MKKIPWVLFVLFSLFVRGADADAFRFPNRSFNGAIVNLNPLFNWWLAPTVHRPLVQNNTTNIASVDVPRPLTAWKLIRGKVVAVRPFAFIVDAKVYTNATGYQTVRIYLYRAPLSEKSEFESLIAERNRLKVLKASAIAANKSAQESADSYFDAASSIRIAHGENVDYVTNPNHNRYNAYEAAGRQARQQADASHQDWWNINDREVQVYKELNKFPDGDEYTVEWFAMDTGKTVQDLPLFDCGQPF